MATTIPQLHQPSCGGIGQLHGKVSSSLASKGSAAKVADIQFVHVPDGVIEAAPVEEFLPGWWRAVEASHGADSSGQRVYNWDPKAGEKWVGDILLEIVPFGGGKPIYEGPAQLRMVQCKAHKKTPTVTLKVRLTDVNSDTHAPELNRHMGEQVEYRMTRTQAQKTPTVGSAPGQTSLPAGGQANVVHVDAGNLVVGFIDGIGDVVAIARMVGPDMAMATSEIGTEGGETFEIARGEIATAIAVCGPNGGPAGPHLDRIAEEGIAEGKLVEAEHVVAALYEAMDDGIEARPEGWALTAQIRGRAVELAGSLPAPAADADVDDDGERAEELPPEAGSPEETEGAEA